jgi:hypothetical protein
MSSETGRNSALARSPAPSSMPHQRMWAWRHWAVILGALLGGALFGVWQGQSRIVAESENARLEIAPEFLDFGEAWEQDAFPWTVSMHNPTRRDIRISRFATSCDCTSIDPQSVTVPAGQSIDVRLTFDLSSPKSSDAQESPRPFSVRLVPTVADPLPPLKGWTIEGQVRRAYFVEPPRIAFGDSLIAGQPYEPQFAIVMTEIPLATLTAETDAPELARASLQPLSADSSTHELRVEPVDSVPVGFHRFHVLLNGVTARGEEIPTATLDILMRVVSDIQPVPGHAAFGSLGLRDSAEETVALSSRTDAGFEVVEVIDSPEDGVHVDPLDAGDNLVSFRIRQHAVALKHQSHDVRFRIRYHEDGALIETTVPVSYYGTPAPLRRDLP